MTLASPTPAQTPPQPSVIVLDATGRVREVHNHDHHHLHMRRNHRPHQRWVQNHQHAHVPTHLDDLKLQQDHPQEQVHDERDGHLEPELDLDAECTHQGESLKRRRRFKIFYRDEALRETCARTTRRVLQDAKRVNAQCHGSEGASSELSNQDRLALKVLRYRKLRSVMRELDEERLNDPSFDVMACLGVQWCKVG